MPITAILLVLLGNLVGGLQHGDIVEIDPISLHVSNPKISSRVTTRTPVLSARTTVPL